MSNQKFYPKGLLAFAPKENAPSFVLPDIVINVDELIEWLQTEGKKHYTDYKGKSQIKLSQVKTKDGKVSISVNTWKPDTSKQTNSQPSKPSAKSDDFQVPDTQDDLPF